MPIGLFIAGWTAEARTHWIAVDIVRGTQPLHVSTPYTDPSPNGQGIVFVGASVILNGRKTVVFVD